jgi:hypothetical protein
MVQPDRVIPPSLTPSPLSHSLIVPSASRSLLAMRPCPRRRPPLRPSPASSAARRRGFRPVSSPICPLSRRHPTLARAAPRNPSPPEFGSLPAMAGTAACWHGLAKGLLVHADLHDARGTVAWLQPVRPRPTAEAPHAPTSTPAGWCCRHNPGVAYLL